MAVVRAAVDEGVARSAGPDGIDVAVRAACWEPVYPPVEAV
ncbi:hypothetical protein AB5J72_22165 [Streptomyces sp. CG1]